MGDEAFEWIRGELHGPALTPPDRVMALRLLSLLTRQFCVRRKGELLEETTALAVRPDVDASVRSAAAHIALVNAGSARRFRDTAAVFGGRTAEEVAALVGEVARRALHLGLTESAEAVVKEYLASNLGTKVD
jgi:hypothetical protein